MANAQSGLPTSATSGSSTQCWRPSLVTMRLPICLLAYFCACLAGCGRDRDSPQTEVAPAGNELGTTTEPTSPPPESLEYVSNSIGMKLVRIPAGTFLMGASSSEAESGEDERPQHRVRISKPFHLSIYEVTQGEFLRVMGKQPSFFSSTGPGKGRVKGMNTDRFPAEQITWNDAVEFCRRLSALDDEKQAGRVYRLPSEAEWEYACRAGSQTPFYFGNKISSRQANFNGKFPYDDEQGPFLARTAIVGSYAPNAFGIYDMHGNVVEWCADRYDRGYYKNSPEIDPRGPATGTERVIRGGDWYSDARDCRAAFRYADIPDGVFYVLGFRVVMTYDDPPLAADKTVGPARDATRVDTAPISPTASDTTKAPSA